MPIRDYARRPVRDLSSLDRLSGIANQFVDLSFRNDLAEQRMLGFEDAPKAPPKKYYYSGLDENKKPKIIKDEQGVWAIEQYGYHDVDADQFVPLPRGERKRLVVNADTKKRADESLNLAKQRLAEAKVRADNNDFKYWNTNKRLLETQLTNLGAQVTKYQQLANTAKDDASKTIFSELADDYSTSVTELQQSYEFINDMANTSVGNNPAKKTSPKTDSYETGQVYEDASGNRAKYLGNGKWEDVK